VGLRVCAWLGDCDCDCDGVPDAELLCVWLGLPLSVRVWDWLALWDSLGETVCEPLCVCVRLGDCVCVGVWESVPEGSCERVCEDVGAWDGVWDALCD
jgi:hypothetical protein